MPQCRKFVIMKTCVMASHVRHSERGSVIADCLVMMCVIASEGLSSPIALL